MAITAAQIEAIWREEFRQRTLREIKDHDPFYVQLKQQQQTTKPTEEEPSKPETAR